MAVELKTKNKIRLDEAVDLRKSSAKNSTCSSKLAMEKIKKIAHSIVHRQELP